MEVWARNRLTWLALGLTVWSLAIFGKLISLQVLQHQKYLAVARAQQEHKIDIPAPRGTIFDRNGSPLALSVPVDSVSVNPHQIQNTRMAAEMLGSVLKLDQRVLYNRLEWAKSANKGFLWIKRKIDPFETERLKALHLDWVTFKTESKREYPKGQTASHVLGAVYRVHDKEEGAAGIERGLEKELQGRDGAERLLMDVKRRGIASEIETAPEAGLPLTLTIDERMQFIAERELKAGVEAKHARSGTAIIMDPYTGEILALANYPTFDPNKPPKQGDDPLSRFDLGVSVPFEPGSIFKVVTLTAALETTNIRPDTLIPTGGGVLRLPGRVIHESHHGYGTITMQEVLEKSSNIGAILIGQRVGRERMYDYARRFGFGQKSGLPLPAESSGLLRPLTRWGTTSLASISMGQEISTTSVQLARACSVMANGGMLVKPKLILKRGNKLEPTEAPKRIIQPETVMKMRMMMEGVVLRGTARRFGRLDGYTSAGKTGTAQIFDVKSHHYTHNYNASFMAFAPLTNPKLVFVVTLNGTVGDSGQGAAAAAPVFNKIANEVLRMLDVPKDIPEPDVPEKLADNKKQKDKGEGFPEEVSLEGIGGKSVMEEDPSVRELLAQQVQPTPDADEIPAAPTGQTAAGFEATAPPPPAPPPTKPQGPTVPDFRGKSLRDVVEEASAQGIDVTLQGSGVARAQLPLPGAPLRNGERIRIVFAR